MTWHPYHPLLWERSFFTSTKVQYHVYFLPCRQKQDEVMRLEEHIRAKADEQRKQGQELDSTCQICLKTKFADGIGHTCNYCNVRCCARCGGKVALRSSKVCIWQKLFAIMGNDFGLEDRYFWPWIIETKCVCLCSIQSSENVDTNWIASKHTFMDN